MATFLALLALAALAAMTGAGAADGGGTCGSLRCKSDGAYNYETLSPRGPAHWGSVVKGAEICKTGLRQSPLDIAVQYSSTPNGTRAPVVSARRCVLDFHPTQLNFKYSVAAEFGACGSVKLTDGASFQLVQVHPHSPSEHRIAGRQYPLELHFVHSAKDGRLAVVGVMVGLGEHNRELQTLLDAASGQGAAVVDLKKLITAVDADSCVLAGSLTTPPCAEGVTWIVSLRSIKASLAQIGQYRAMVGEKTNNRPLQPRNGRPVVCFARKKAVLPGFI